MRFILRMSKLFVNASECAAFLGLHTYVKRHEVFERVWRRFDKPGYADALRRNDMLTKTEQLDHVLQKNAAANLVLETAKSSSVGADSAGHVRTNLETSLKALAIDDPADLKLVSDELRKLHYCTYGTENESGIFDILTGELGDIRAGDSEYVSRQLGIVGDGVAVFIGGKIDGISADGKFVLEIKNRVNRLFITPTAYETIQCQCYLAIFQDAEKCVLAEALRGDDSSLTINIVDIPRDDETLRRKIIANAEFLVTLAFDEHLQDTYLRSKKKTFFLKKAIDERVERPGFLEN
jgi:hypothetical protein